MSSRLVEQRVGNILLMGYSVAGEETVVAAPEFNVCFDVGKAPREMVTLDYVLLSHGHMDHAAGLAYYFSQRNFLGIAPGTALVPVALVEPLRDLMATWARIEGHPSPAEIVGMTPGDEHPIRRGLMVRSFAPHHGPNALGFTLIEVKHKLLPELLGKSQREIIALKRAGKTIERRVEVPLLTYCGDTALGPFLDLPMVKTSKVLLIECTFFEPDHLHRARAGYHLHLRDLADIVPRLENESIVLTHLSRRTGIAQAKRALKGLLTPADCRRICFLMDRRRSSSQTGASAPAGEASGDPEPKSAR
jgi:ribonuclease Z